MAAASVLLNVSSAKHVAQFPFCPFGDSYNFNSTDPSHIGSIIAILDRTSMIQSVFGSNYPTLSELKKHNINTVLLASGSHDLDQSLRTMTATRVTLLKLIEKFYSSTKNHYLSFNFIDSQNREQNACSLCCSLFSGTFASHLNTCLPSIERQFQSYACVSCKCERTVSYSEASHMCSQSHYNNHFRCIALTRGGDLVHLSSLQADYPVLPHFLALLQLAFNKQYYSTSSISNNWLDHMVSTKSNLTKQTYDINNHMETLFETISEFGELSLPCARCENSAIRVSGVDYVDFCRTVLVRSGQKLSETKCDCGATTLKVDSKLVECYREAFTKKAGLALTVVVDPDTVGGKRTIAPQKQAAVNVLTMSRIMSHPTLIPTGNGTNSQSQLQVVKDLLSLNAVQKNTVFNLKASEKDVEFIIADHVGDLATNIRVLRDSLEGCSPRFRTMVHHIRNRPAQPPDAQQPNQPPTTVSITNNNLLALAMDTGGGSSNKRSRIN